MEYPNDSWAFCIQLTSGKKPLLKPDGKTEQVTDETQFDRIMARSDDYVMTPKGIVKGKQVVIQDLRYQNPYILVIAKVVDESTADMIKEFNELDWNNSIEEMKDQLDVLKGKKEPVPETTEG